MSCTIAYSVVLDGWSEKTAILHAGGGMVPELNALKRHGMYLRLVVGALSLRGADSRLREMANGGGAIVGVDYGWSDDGNAGRAIPGRGRPTSPKR